jgi:uncharacterized protein
MKEYKTRSIETTLNKMINKFPAILITGARQVGKTTLLNHLQQENSSINYVSLDNMLLRAQANEDPELFLRSYETPLIIDEFQYAPNLLTYIKIKVDESRKKAMFETKEEVGTLYYLTGSQVFETMKDVSESLAGRVGILDLYGFSTREINNEKDITFIPDIELLRERKKLPILTMPKLFERIINGSYPDVVNATEEIREKFYESYIRTYIERDVRKLINIKDETKFIKFISSVAARTSQEYNASDIAKDVEIDSKTAEEWLSILKNTNLVYMLNSYSNNNIKKIVKRPKLYFMDTGLACYLTGYFNVTTLERSAYAGAIFETYVITEIIKSYANNGKSPKQRLYYYRDHLGKEIDLLIIYDNKIYPVEIKKSSNPGINAIKNFDVVTNFGYEVGTGLVLCMMENIISINENNYYVPIEYI